MEIIETEFWLAGQCLYHLIVLSSSAVAILKDKQASEYVEGIGNRYVMKYKAPEYQNLFKLDDYQIP